MQWYSGPPSPRHSTGNCCAGLTFEEVWRRRRTFRSAAVEVPVASLADILAAKAAADRPKDRLFLATNAAELKRLLG
jgi:hypothetical protein